MLLYLCVYCISAVHLKSVFTNGNCLPGVFDKCWNVADNQVGSEPIHKVVHSQSDPAVTDNHFQQLFSTAATDQQKLTLISQTQCLITCRNQLRNGRN